MCNSFLYCSSLHPVCCAYPCMHLCASSPPDISIHVSLVHVFPLRTPTVIFSICAWKAYGESVCRSRVPLSLWEEGERRGGDGEESGCRLCTNRWHSTLLWLATVTQTKTGLEALCIYTPNQTGSWMIKKKINSSFFFSPLITSGCQQLNEREVTVWRGVGVEVKPL